MRGKVQERAIALIQAIVLEEALARVFVHAAWEIEADGSISGADTMRSVARHHRIKALEDRGRLAALGEEYSWLFPDASNKDP
ncbi:hypothetical protein [Methylobacterium oxalidis]|uniref:hypothetical protein n=1 Tax=Methylobacterium oxalidis TaxID=944322 RepID=UPI0033146AE4